MLATGTLDALVTLTSLIFPSAMSFIRRKFIKHRNDTPEATINDLALSKPEILQQYMDSYCKLLDAKTKFFNRDVIGTPSKWIVDLRSAIIPFSVVFSFCALGIIWLGQLKVDAGLLYFFTATASSWTGHRISLKI